MERIKLAVAELRSDMVKWRRHLHRHPELSFQEHNTIAFVLERLKEEGIEVRSGVGS